MGNRLTKIKWNEISGVDQGANETPGWLLEKSKKLGDEAKEFEKAVIAAYEGVAGDEVKLYFADASEDVKKALGSVIDYFEKGIEDESGSEKEDEDENLLEKLRNLLKGTDTSTESEKGDKDEEDEETVEKKDVEKSEEKKDETGDTEDEEVSKSIDSDELAKALGGIVSKELEPLREAIVAIADRTEGLEKAAGVSAQPAGQEGDSEDGDGEKDEEKDLTKAIRTAFKTGKVTLK